jgi:hypothetical protein
MTAGLKIEHLWCEQEKEKEREREGGLFWSSFPFVPIRPYYLIPFLTEEKFVSILSDLILSIRQQMAQQAAFMRELLGDGGAENENGKTFGNWKKCIFCYFYFINLSLID